VPIRKLILFLFVIFLGVVGAFLRMLAERPRRYGKNSMVFERDCCS